MYDKFRAFPDYLYWHSEILDMISRPTFHFGAVYEVQVRPNLLFFVILHLEQYKVKVQFNLTCAAFVRSMVEFPNASVCDIPCITNPSIRWPTSMVNMYALCSYALVKRSKLRTSCLLLIGLWCCGGAAR